MALKRIFSTAIMAMAAAAAASSARISLAASSEDQIERSFSVQPGGKLVIDSDRGAIDVQPSEVPKLAITVERRVRRASDERAAQILRDHTVEFEQNGKTVTVRARYANDHIWSWNQPSLEVKFIVLAPKEFNLDLHTAGGGITVKELSGELAAKTSGGGIRLGTIDGPVAARTAGGSIHLDRGRGQLHLQTSGGGITVHAGEGSLETKTAGGSITIGSFKGDAAARTSGGGIRGENISGTFQASTSGGSIHANFTQVPRGKCQLETSGGGISVEVPAQAALDLDAQTSGGTVRSELPVRIEGKWRRSILKGPVNGGGVPLILRTSGGSIQLNKL